MAVEWAEDWRPPHDVDMAGVDEILRGGYDLHVHAAPDMRPRQMDVVRLVEEYRSAGFSGALIKDHFLPTVGRSYVLNAWRQDFRCLGSCALNTPSGGFNAAHVEAAVAEGAVWVFMPTATAAHFVNYTGRTPETERLLRGATRPQSVLDGGVLRPEVHEVLEVLAARDVVLASGHLSPAETRVLFAEARRKGIDRRVVTHASIDFIDMPLELQLELAADGAIIEHCYVSCLWHRPIALKRVLHQVRAVGPARCYLASDLGQPENPSPVTGLRAAVGGLQALGLSRRELRQLVVDTPRSLVPPVPPSGVSGRSA